MGWSQRSNTYNFRVPEALLFSKFYKNTYRVHSKLLNLPAEQTITNSIAQATSPAIVVKSNFPADVMLIDLVGKMHPSPHTFILSGIDVFSRYLFAAPLMKCDANLVVKALNSTFLRHSYIPSTKICDLGTPFTSELMRELANLLQIQLKHCTLKHAQTIGLLERIHAFLKQILRINENQN